MLKNLFKRMAPLVAGVMLAATVCSVHAHYPYIEGFEYINSYEVLLDTREPESEIKTFWWLDGTYEDSLDEAMQVDTYPGVDNVAVYVYLNDDHPSTNHYSWASIDDVWGTNIYNG
jgi:hypothetical protein